MSKKPDFCFIVKPTNDCNLNCEYCFDRESRMKRLGKRLSLEDIDKIAKMGSEYAETVNWVWHGGECTVMGKEYFEKAQDAFVKYYDTTFSQTMQTNGIIISEDTSWIPFLDDLGISFGISYDLAGQKLRDSKDRDLLKNITSVSCRCGYITVVTRENSDKLLEMYKRAQKEFGKGHSMSFNLGFEFRNQEPALDLSTFKDSLEEYFEYWLYDTTVDVLKERLALTLIRGLSGYMKNPFCGSTNCLGYWISVFGNGDLFTCDREMENYKLGNLKDFNNIDEVWESEAYKRLSKHVNERYEKYCNKCPYLGRLNCRCVSNHTNANSTGLANEIDKRTCEKHVMCLNVAYNVLQRMDSIDILNVYAYETIHSDILFTPKEITEFLKSKGLEFELFVPVEILHKGMLHTTKQYEVFQIFNPVRMSKLPYNIEETTRNNMLQAIYEMHEDKIKNIIERGEC